MLARPVTNKKWHQLEQTVAAFGTDHAEKPPDKDALDPDALRRELERLELFPALSDDEARDRDHWRAVLTSALDLMESAVKRELTAGVTLQVRPMGCTEFELQTAGGPVTRYRYAFRNEWHPDLRLVWFTKQRVTAFLDSDRTYYIHARVKGLDRWKRKDYALLSHVRILRWSLLPQDRRTGVPPSADNVRNWLNALPESCRRRLLKRYLEKRQLEDLRQWLSAP